MLKCQASMRNHLRFMIDAVQRDQNEELHSQVIQRVMSLSRNLPEPPKANDCLKKFYRILLDDQRIRDHLAKLTSPDCPCKKAEEHVVSCDVFYTPVRSFGLDIYLMSKAVLTLSIVWLLSFMAGKCKIVLKTI